MSTGLSKGQWSHLSYQLLHRVPEFRRKRGSDEGDGKPDGRVYCISLLVPDQYPDRRKDGRRQVG